MPFSKLLPFLFFAVLAHICLPTAASAATPSGEVTVLTIVDVTPDYAMHDNVEHSRALLTALARASRSDAGNITFKILGDVGRANHFIMISTWKSIQSFEAYSGSDAAKRFRTAFQPGNDGPFDERIYFDLN